MERDLTPREDSASPPDDAELGALVRAVAEDWHRPPQRLDQPTWRERVDGSRRPSTADRAAGAWIGRLAEAGVLAVAATVVLAIGAVFLTSPGRNGIVGSNPSTNPDRARFADRSRAARPRRCRTGSPLPASS